MANTYSERVAAEIRAEMARQRRTATELATELGMSESTLGRKLRGEYPMNVTEIDNITALLGITPRELSLRVEQEVA